MKLYTLTYDCNTPTKQQVNIPTNTDYKLGIKVRRNGEIQNLSPDSVTLGGLSADAEKTNGYVTFTLSTDDEASYTQETIDIQHGYEEAYLTSNIMQNTTGADLTATFLSVDLSEYAGTTINATDVKLTGLQSRTEITEDDLKESMVRYWDADWPFFSAPTGLIVDNNGTPKIYVMGQDIKLDMLKSLGWPSDKPAFFGADPDGQHYKMYETYTIQEGDKLIVGPNRRLRANQYGGARFQFTVGTPFSASFDLNTNVFKSQQGDIDIAAPDQTTVNISGKFSDNTDFSYDFVVA